ncbi:hypothetical protein niasHT_010830 [Heterodera trifolii]|uniref:Uncharacterized protein n=1 Tax=Heterodera trifolii TaxID=157864 RepID=A0ABD2KWD2_9BILA
MNDEFVVAKFDYEAQEERELSVTKNERLKLLDDTNPWWKAMNARGQIGFVPSNYMQKESIGEKDKENFRSANHLSNGHGKRLHSVAVVLFDYAPQRDDELALRRGVRLRVLDKSADGWWKGEEEGAGARRGWFPSNYVREQPADDELPELSENGTPKTNGIGTTADARQTQHIPDRVLEIVLCLYSFEAQNPQELSFVKHERLDILEHPVDDPEWWMARNQYGQTGLVPTNYIEVVDQNPNRGAFDSPGVSAAPPSVPSSSLSPVPPSPRPNSYIGNSDWDQLTGPYARQPWYYGHITREQSDTLLKTRGVEGDFLVRDSESKPGDFSISLKDSAKNKHFWVQFDAASAQFIIGNRRFESMEKLILNYMSSPIFSDGIVNLFLRKPLPK